MRLYLLSALSGVLLAVAIIASLGVDLVLP